MASDDGCRQQLTYAHAANGIHPVVLYDANFAAGYHGCGYQSAPQGFQNPQRQSPEADWNTANRYGSLPAESHSCYPYSQPHSQNAYHHATPDYQMHSIATGVPSAAPYEQYPDGYVGPVLNLQSQIPQQNYQVFCYPPDQNGIVNTGVPQWTNESPIKYASNPVNPQPCQQPILKEYEVAAMEPPLSQVAPASHVSYNPPEDLDKENRRKKSNRDSQGRSRNNVKVNKEIQQNNDKLFDQILEILMSPSVSDFSCRRELIVLTSSYTKFKPNQRHTKNNSTPAKKVKKNQISL